MSVLSWQSWCIIGAAYHSQSLPQSWLWHAMIFVKKLLLFPSNPLHFLAPNWSWCQIYQWDISPPNGEELRLQLSYVIWENMWSSVSCVCSLESCLLEDSTLLAGIKWDNWRSIMSAYDAWTLPMWESGLQSWHQDKPWTFTYCQKWKRILSWSTIIVLILMMLGSLNLHFRE